MGTTGTVLDRIDYDSFGKIVNETTPANGDRFKFTAREGDSEIGQYYYRARSFGPLIGRFFSPDPKGFAANDMNLYRYTANNPINRTDATGTDFLGGLGRGLVGGGSGLGAAILGAFAAGGVAAMAGLAITISGPLLIGAAATGFLIGVIFGASLGSDETGFWNGGDVGADLG